jgi:L-rhamnose mutarotase
MKKTITTVVLAAVAAAFLLAFSCAKKESDQTVKSEAKKTVKRVGMVVGIKPEVIGKYKELHADSNPGVRDLLAKYHMRNFSIFLQKIDGKWYEFGYYEYDGDNFEADMAKLDSEPRNKEWLKICDPMQIPLPGAKGWTQMERVYFNE